MTNYKPLNWKKHMLLVVLGSFILTSIGIYMENDPAPPCTSWQCHFAFEFVMTQLMFVVFWLLVYAIVVGLVLGIQRMFQRS
jgi:hypothetical protein